MRIRTGSRVSYFGSITHLRHSFGTVEATKYCPFMDCFIYTVRMEDDGKVYRFNEHELDSYRNHYDDCDCGGVYLEVENHYEWCSIYEYFIKKRDGVE